MTLDASVVTLRYAAIKLTSHRDAMSTPDELVNRMFTAINENKFALLMKQEIRSVEHGICPIAEFTSHDFRRHLGFVQF